MERFWQILAQKGPYFRGTLALVQLFVIYFGLPDVGLRPTPLQAAIVGLGINGAAYLAEIYRAGIGAIHRGQMEAALTLGMTPLGAMRYIVLPQAIRTMLPPITNVAVTLQSMHVYLMAAAIYLCMTIPLSRFVAALERARRAWH